MITAAPPTVAIRRALLSVSDKQQLLSLAQTLQQLNIEILSTGGTAKLLSEAGIPIIKVANFTDYPEIMDGRVKTLHPKIHGGILARRQQDQAIMQQQQILPIDLVVVNLYPFVQTIQQADCTFAQAIENIDIGGPTMIRAAAKNHQDVTVVVDPHDYPLLIQLLKQHQGAIPFDYRFNLAVKAFEHTAKYDAEIANYFGQHLTAYRTTEQAVASSQLTEKKQLFPRTLHVNFTKQQDLRYGENSHQAAALYLTNESADGSIAHAQQLQGKALSYNNFADSDAALACVNSFTQPSCVIVKHANPCGVASHQNLSEAYLQAFNTDPISAFGGIIAFNRPLDEITAKTIIDKQFVEVIIAPAVTEQAQQLLQTKNNLRVLVTGQASHPNQPCWDFKRINGGLLVQQQDVAQLSMTDWQVVTQQQPTQQQQQDALFAWQVAKFVKSNAIVYAKASTTLGIGAGQMSRVDSAKIALLKAQQQQLSLANAVMASDAFFPFRDSIEFAAQAGIRCIIQPGGSLRDQEVIAAADEYQIAMLFTGIRHFRH